MRAIVTGPYQLTFPWFVKIVNDDGVEVAGLELPGSPMHREEAEAQAQADEFNRKQQESAAYK